MSNKKIMWAPPNCPQEWLYKILHEDNSRIRSVIIPFFNFPSNWITLDIKTTQYPIKETISLPPLIIPVPNYTSVPNTIDWSNFVLSRDVYMGAT